MYKKMDKFLWRFTAFSLFATLILYMIGAEIESSKQHHFLFSIFSQMFVLLPLLYFIKKEKNANGTKQKVFAGLANALFFSTIFYWITQKFNVLNDYYVIGLFIILFSLAFIMEMGTKLVSGFLYTYFAIMLFTFFMGSGTFQEKVYYAVSLKTVGMNLSLFWWLMLLVSYILAHPPGIKSTLKKKNRKRVSMQKNQNQPKKSLKDLHKPVFRKQKKKLRDYINKA